MLEYALQYLKRGWSIVPGKGKYPCVDWKEYEKRHATEEEVREWWRQWPDANILVITGEISGIVVVDIDTDRGGTSEGLPPTGWISKTGSGGYHYIYQYPAGIPRIRNKVGKDGVDVRADGGCIVLPPSLHPTTGQYYEWESDGPTLGTCPKWTYKKNVEEEGEDAPKEKWVADLIEKGSAPGSRNDDTARLAGYYAGKEIPLDIALVSIQAWMARQENPLTVDDVDTTVRSVYRTDEDNHTGESHPFRLQTYNDFMDEHAGSSIEWLVQNWFPAETIAFAISEPGARKTWISFDLAVSIAADKPFMGKYKVNNPGPVIIVQMEDFNAQTASRINLISAQKHNPDLEEGVYIPYLPDLPIHFHPDRNFRFENEKCMLELKRAIKRIKPRLVIFDPLYAALDIEDYMMKGAKSMFPLKKLRDEFSCAFFISHHAKKQLSSTLNRLDLWGSTFLNAFIETGFQIRKVNDDTTVLGRHYKQEGAQEPVRLDWSINSGFPMKYEVTATPISSETLRELLSEDTSEDKKKGGRPKEKRVTQAFVQKVQKAQEKGLGRSQIALALEVEETEVARAFILIQQMADSDPYKKV